MNLLITIFGGMLLTVLIYAAARGLKLSNFWAAVAASALPSVAYVIYAVALWPGLDVLTLHVIAYPTVAVLLYQLYGGKASIQQGTHWAPKLMIGFFVVITVLYGGFVYIAGQGLPPALARLLLPGAENKNIHTGFAGVVAHGEDAAKEVGHHLGMEAKLHKLGWRLEVSGLDALTPQRSGSVEVRVIDPDGQGVDGVPVTLTLRRPGQDAGEVVTLAGLGGGQYQAPARLPATGAWLAVLGLRAGDEYISLERRVGGE